MIEKSFRRMLFYFVMILIGIMIGLWVSYQFKAFSFERTTEESATVLLESVRSVAKLVAVEGQVSEIYNYNSYPDGFDYDMFRKKALVKVQAVVSIGYDLENLNININNSSKVMRISNVPEAQILSIDYDLEYYDMQEGIFTSFDEKDLSAINKRVKVYIESLVENGELGLQHKAEIQLKSIFNSIAQMAHLAGYKVDFETFQPSLNQ